MIYGNKELPEFSNPRKFAEFDNWPFGKNRIKCQFEVEKNNKGKERVLRRTENKTRTGWNKDKKTTYAENFVIVDGSDDRTYILSTINGSISIRSSDFMSYGYISKNDEKYEKLKNLIF